VPDNGKTAGLPDAGNEPVTGHQAVIPCGDAVDAVDAGVSARTPDTCRRGV